MAKKTARGKGPKTKPSSKKPSSNKKPAKAAQSKSTAKGISTSPSKRATSASQPSSTDIRRAYMKSLLSDYLGKRG